MTQEVQNSRAAQNTQSTHSTQYSTFYVADQIYGIEVTQVQEIVKPMPLTKIPLVPECIKGLINLRGQVTTAIGMRELLGISSQTGTSENSEYMNVVCQYEDNLVSLLVDEIGDVFSVEASDFEQTPQTIPNSIKRFMVGVYKVNNSSLLSIIDLQKIVNYLNELK
ncbi:MAG: chemotaxis protein CheW [Oligoflexales bacterium]